MSEIQDIIDHIDHGVDYLATWIDMFIDDNFEGAEGDLAVRRAFERQMRLFDEIEEIVVPDIHFDDTPATGKGLGDGWNLGHVSWSQR